MQIIEREKFYLMVYLNDRNQPTIFNQKPWQNLGTAKWNYNNFLNYISKSKKGSLVKKYKNVKIIELDINDPKKSEFIPEGELSK